MGLRIFRTATSHVVGKIEEDLVELESTANLFPRRFMGSLQSSPEGCVLEGHWVYPFGSKFWGDVRSDEEVLLKFLFEYAQFEKAAQ